MSVSKHADWDLFIVDPGTRYELAVCLEKTEHLNESSADNLDPSIDKFSKCEGLFSFYRAN